MNLSLSWRFSQTAVGALRLPPVAIVSYRGWPTNLPIVGEIDAAIAAMIRSPARSVLPINDDDDRIDRIGWAPIPWAPRRNQPEPLLTEDEYAECYGEGARSGYAEYLENDRKYGHPDNDHVDAWRRHLRNPKTPFMFEHLPLDWEGKRAEPKSWGPLYPKTLPGVEAWRKLEKRRELSAEEKRAYGAAVGAAIRKLNSPAEKRVAISLRCTVQNTTGTDCTAAGEEKRYQAWLDRLAATRRTRTPIAAQWKEAA